MRAIHAIAALGVGLGLSLGMLLGAVAAHAAPIGEASAALIDGQRVDGHPVSAVGALLATADDGHRTEGAFMCSAVLVAPTVALTAAHCVALVEADAAEEGWRLDWWLSFESDVSGFGGRDPVLPRWAVAVHPVVHGGFDAGRAIRSDRPDVAHDIAVLLLAEPVSVTPVPMARAVEGIDRGADSILLAGYGLSAFDPEAAPGERQAGRGRVFTLGSHEMRVGRATDAEAPPPAGLAEKCGGDSGGPTFARTVDGWRVIGVTSRAHAADPGCAIAGFDTRVDAYAGWVDSVAAGSVDGGAMGCTVTRGRGAGDGLGGLMALALVGLRVSSGRVRRRC